MNKRLVSLVLAFVLVFVMAIPAMAAAPLVEEAEYEGRGYVEVDFRSKVTYKNVRVTVKDAGGTKYSARITEKDGDDLTFCVAKIKPGVKYTYVISGIRAGRKGAYTSVKGTFKVPAGQVWIKEIEYDRSERALEIEFNGRVQYKNLKVVVKDTAGKVYPCRILEKGRDDIELSAKGLTDGRKYTVTVQGVCLKGTGKYESVSETFQLSKR